MEYLIQFVYLSIAAGIGWMIGYQTGWIISESKIQQSQNDSLQSVKNACEGLRSFIDEMDQFADEISKRNMPVDNKEPTRSRAGE